MGAQLVARASALVLPRLDPNRHDRARLVLLAMCHHAKDTDARPTYFAGSANLGEMLGFPPGDAAGERAVSRAVEVLAGLGLVERVGRTSARGKRRWLLTFATRPLGESGPVDSGA